MKSFVRYVSNMIGPVRGILFPGLFRRILLGAALVVAGVNAAIANTLQDISYFSLSGDTVRVTLRLSEPAAEPEVFTIDNPARIALDLPGTSNVLSSRSGSIGIGVVNGFSSAEAGGRTRVVLNLSQMTTYKTQVSDNAVIITLGNLEGQIADTVIGSVANQSPSEGSDNSIQKVDFRRGEEGEGLIQVTLPSANTFVDMRQEGSKLVIDFISTRLPQSLQRTLDVKDFATPVHEVRTFSEGKNTRMEIKLDPLNEHLAYQSNEDFVIEVKPLTAAQEEVAKRKGRFFGEKLSLNFQNIEVRSALQLLADFTGLNVIVSDTVSGSLTLRLKDVPWDQALDIILRTKGLAQRQTGNVILIAPAAEVANTERLELEAVQQVRELEPLIAEFIPINYADAGDIQGIIQSDGAALLSDRGGISVDERTNTLLVRETASRIDEVRALITELDVPIKQVLIESRIVSATDDFTKGIGVRFGFNKQRLINSRPGETKWSPGNKSASYAIGGSLEELNPSPDGSTADELGQNLLVDLPSSAVGGRIGLAVGKIGSYVLQLELSAMQTEGRGEVISNPRLVTADKKQASIKAGVQIPYQEAASSGATSISYQDAALSLDVTPQITPDNRIIMDLAVSRDTVGQVLGGAGGAPSVDTQSLETQVVVDNGETVVLGGVYERTVDETLSRVPFFSDLPYIGWAFRRSRNVDNKTELLIFVTPKILQEESQLN